MQEHGREQSEPDRDRAGRVRNRDGPLLDRDDPSARGIARITMR